MLPSRATVFDPSIAVTSGAKLRLAAGAPQIEHQITRNLQSESRTVIFFDQSQRQIHSSCDPGGSINVFVTDKYWIGIDVRARRAFDQGLTPIPMSRGAATIEQAGAGQEHCASANRADSPDSSGDSFQPTHRFRINFILLDRVAAGHEQRIDLSAYFAKGLIRGDAQPAIGNQRSTRRNSHHFDRINRRRSRIFPGVHFRCAGEDLKRSDQVENLDAGPRHEHDPPCPRFEWRFVVLSTRFDFNWRSRILPIEA